MSEQEQEQQGDSGGEEAHKSPNVHPRLDEGEQQEVEQRSSVSAKVVYGAIQKEGEDELKRTSDALFWSALAAGLAMGFSLVMEGLLRHYLPDTPWRPVITKLGYSVGFLIVILGRQQLFTENTLTPILPLLTRRSRDVLLNVLRLWGVVLVANLLGALIFAWILGNTNVFDASIRRTFGEIGLEAVKEDFWTTLIRGVFAGWLIALMVWLLPFAEMARIWVIIIITYVVGLAGFAHIIAGSVEAFFVAVTGQVGWDHVLLSFVVPALIGNILGGVVLVAGLAHAQTASDEGGEDA
jgi:formate-nitrite transporter family protein